MSALSIASVATDSSVIDQALSLINDMSFSDKLAFNAKLASLLAKETKGAGIVAKAAKKEKKAKDPDAPKRVAGAGQKAWFAFIEHCIATMPDRFTEAPLRKDKLAVVKCIRAEDKAIYDAFVAKYKEEHPSAAAAASEADADADDAEDSEQETVVVKAPVASAEAKPMTAAEKIAMIKAKRAAEAAAKEVKAAPAPAPTAAKKPLIKGTAKAKAKPVVESSEDGSLARISIDGTDYHRDTSMNGLWKVADDGEGFGAWVGYYQPGNDEEPIRFTESPSDE
jgi:hypothetical protein